MTTFWYLFFIFCHSNMSSDRDWALLNVNGTSGIFVWRVISCFVWSDCFTLFIGVLLPSLQHYLWYVFFTFCLSTSFCISVLKFLKDLSSVHSLLFSLAVNFEFWIAIQAYLRNSRLWVQWLLWSIQWLYSCYFWKLFDVNSGCFDL